MINDIVEKLNKNIQKGVTSEANVVYLMVETRKLLEHTEAESKKFPILTFYTNWVVHTRLDRSHPSRKTMLDHINKAAFAYVHFDRRGASVHVPVQISKAISFYPLREEMERFFRKNSIKTDLLNNRNWKSFILLLIEILIDTPLEDLKNEFSSMREFSFIQKLNSESWREDKKAVACWRLVCKNGAILEGPVYLQE